MWKNFVQYLFMLLVIVYLKDGSNIWFEKADSYLIRETTGNFAEKILWLDIRQRGKTLSPATVAVFNWDEVRYVEAK